MGQQIQKLRNQKNINTQEELAKKMCVPLQTIRNVENGTELYNGQLVSKLKKILGNFSWEK